MTDDVRAAERSLHGRARFAGLLYAIGVATGVFGLSVGPRQVFDGETPAEMVQSLIANESLYRMSIAAEIVCYAVFLVLALALYRLLSPAGKFAAALMAALLIASVPLALANVEHHFVVLRLIEGASAQDAQSAVMSAKERYSDGIFVLNILWGAWLIPFGYLVIRSGFLPRILGILLILGGAGYIADIFGQLLFSSYEGARFVRILRGPAEMLIGFWLLIFGARRTLLPERRRSLNA